MLCRPQGELIKRTSMSGGQSVQTDGEQPRRRKFARLLEPRTQQSTQFTNCDWHGYGRSPPRLIGPGTTPPDRAAAAAPAACRRGLRLLPCLRVSSRGSTSCAHVPFPCLPAGRGAQRGGDAGRAERHERGPRVHRARGAVQLHRRGVPPRLGLHPGTQRHPGGRRPRPPAHGREPAPCTCLPAALQLQGGACTLAAASCPRTHPGGDHARQGGRSACAAGMAPATVAARCSPPFRARR